VKTFNIPEPNGEELADYIRTRGNSSKKTLEILATNLHFIDAINTEVGGEVLKDLVQMHKEAFLKIAELGASDEDKVRYKVLQDLINRWSKRVADYYQTLERVDKLVKPNKGGTADAR